MIQVVRTKGRYYLTRALGVLLHFHFPSTATCQVLSPSPNWWVSVFVAVGGCSEALLQAFAGP